MTTLTLPQESRLDKLPEETKVVGWHPKGGPILRGPTGNHVYINKHGHLKPVAKQYLKEDK